MSYAGGKVVHTEELPWLPLAPKISVRVLMTDRETGSFSVMVRAEPGGVLPRHQHVERAEILVIKGRGTHPQTGDYRTGEYISEPKGAIHDVVHFTEENVLLMVCEGPSNFLGADGSVELKMDVGMLDRLAAQTGKVAG